MGTAGALGALGSTASAASDEDEVSKEPLQQARLDDIFEELRRSPEYRKIVARMRRTVRGPLERGDVSGRVIEGPDEEAIRGVYVDFESRSDDVDAGVVWVAGSDQERIFGHLAGTGTSLKEVPEIHREQTGSSAAVADGDRVRVQRFVRPASDTATAAVLPADVSEDEQGLDDVERLDRIDVESQSVSTLSTSDLGSCVTQGAGGIVGVGSCAETCRRGCFTKPNPYGCLLCAGCSAVVGCHLGKCADEHFPALCDYALMRCVSPMPPLVKGECSVAYGCLYGNCWIIG